MWKVVIACVVLLVTACATSGKNFDEAKAKQFVVGVTTIEDAQQIMGPPERVERNTEGRTRLTWRYAQASTFTGVHAKMVAAVFDPQGKFLRISEEMKN